MGLKDKIKKLEKVVQGSTESFELSDGTRYHFDPTKTFSQTFLHFTNVLRADYARSSRPEPPEILRAVARAKNRRRALAKVMRGSSFLAYEEDALVERGKLIPRSLVAEGSQYEPIGGGEE